MDESVRGEQEPGEAKAEPGGADRASREPSIANAPAAIAPRAPEISPAAVAVTLPLTPGEGEDRQDGATPQPSERVPAQDPADAPHPPEDIATEAGEVISPLTDPAGLDVPAPAPQPGNETFAAEPVGSEPDADPQDGAGVPPSDAALSEGTSSAAKPRTASPSDLAAASDATATNTQQDAAPPDHYVEDDPVFDREDPGSDLDQGADNPTSAEEAVSEAVTAAVRDGPTPAEPPGETSTEPGVLKAEKEAAHTDFAVIPAEEKAGEQSSILDDHSHGSSVGRSPPPGPDAKEAVPHIPAHDPAIIDAPEAEGSHPALTGPAHEPIPADHAPEPPRPHVTLDPPSRASSLPDLEITPRPPFEPIGEEASAPLREEQIWSGPETADTDRHFAERQRDRSLSIGAFAIAIPAAGASSPAPSHAIEHPAQSLAAGPSVSLPSRETLDQGRSYLRLAMHITGAAVIALATTVLLLILLYRWVDPPTSNLMLGQRLLGTEINQRWVPINRVSPHLVQAVILSEDGAFCQHRGVDWSAMSEAIESARGGSTITMQVVKNLFLWPARSYVRKALEIVLAYVVELAWTKQRILEIYLNIAEMGPGIFGAEAAARNHFGKRASQLTAQEAALLAVSLPNPIERQAGFPGWQTRRLANNLLIRMRAVRSPVRCVR